MTRRRAELPRHYVEGPETLTQEELAASYGADPADIARVREVLGRFGLDVTVADAGARRLTASGPASAFAAAFGVSLRMVTSPDTAGGPPVTHRYREGSLQLPADLDGIVTAVLGLDTRPQASPHFRTPSSASAGAAASADPAAGAGAAASYTPPQIGTLYNFPSGTDGTGQTIAIIELGGGYAQADLNTYFGALGIAVPAVAAVSVDGGANSPGVNQNADTEVCLDVQVAGALAPKASLLVYFAPNTDQSFIDAVSSAVHANPAPTAISISWGKSEDYWAAQTRTAMDQQFQDAAALGTSVFAASADHGAGDNVGDGVLHCDFPASSPNAIGCGGTTQTGTTATGGIAPETTWNNATGATGGGISDAWALPGFQSSVTMPAGKAGRGVPDVAGNADPDTGYQVRVNGQNTVIGGTSAVAPLWAALTCRLVQRAGRPLSNLVYSLYNGVVASSPAFGFQDVTAGSNNGYNAGAGWDACTGLGTPYGTALVMRLGTGQQLQAWSGYQNGQTISAPSYASLTLNGSTLSVYVNITGSNQPNATFTCYYKLDGGAPVNTGVSFTTSGSGAGMATYSIPNLSPGAHSIIIEVNGGPAPTYCYYMSAAANNGANVGIPFTIPVTQALQAWSGYSGGQTLATPASYAALTPAPSTLNVQLSLVGTNQPSSTFHALYKLDGSAPVSTGVSFTTDVNGNGSAAYTIPNLAVGQHSIIIEVNGGPSPTYCYYMSAAANNGANVGISFTC